MKLSRFVNNPENTPLHSSGLAGESASAPQSFTEREQMERNRRIVRSYHESLIGTARAERGQIRPAKRPAADTTPTAPSRQQFNAPGGQGFTEPPTRGYNPYS